MYRIFNTLQEYEDFTNDGKDLVAGDIYIVKDGKTIHFETNNIDGVMEKYDYMGEIPPGYIIPSGTVSISENGTGINVNDYAYADVNVPPDLELGYFYSNGEYYPSNSDGFSKVTVGVPDPILIRGNFAYNGRYSAIDSQATGYSVIDVNVAPDLELGYFTSNGEYYPSNSDGFSKVTVGVPEPVLELGYFTQNGNYSPTTSQGYSSVTVSVPSPDIYIKSLIDGVAPTEAIPLNIPEGTTKIPNNKFDGWTYLTGQLNMPSSVTSIGNYAFKNCSNLTGQLNIPSGVTRIGEGAFDGCSGITGTPVIPQGQTIAYMNMYHNCSSLNGPLTIPNSVTTFQHQAFNRAGITGDLIIPNTVTSIGDERNYGGNNSVFCRTNITSVTIPNTITLIPVTTFYNCPNLTTVNMGNSVTKIGNDAFSYCPSLTYINIPDSVTTIGDRLLEQCTSLTEVIIPSSVTSIGASAFRGCTGLTKATILATTPPTISSASIFAPFQNTNNCPIYVPAASVEDYKAASGWSDLASRIFPIPEP